MAHRRARGDARCYTTPKRCASVGIGNGRRVTDDALASDKTLIVRVNTLDTPHFAADIDAVARNGVSLVNLPKPESADDVRAADALAAAERANGVTAPIGLLLNVETPRTLRLGLDDLFEPLGIARRETFAIQEAMFSLRMAVGEAGVFAYDTAFANIKDADGFHTEAQIARAFGFIGKSCIHPSQITIANEVFRPSDEDIAHAVHVVVAARDADAKGVGRLCRRRPDDRPAIRRARARWSRMRRSSAC
ncbi:Malyl-CoA lyase [Candidatus Burkholderia brachyanthoides]|nr:Malyl-CoA lyase [Candidatus Burkholderia brachyanthoides]